MNPRGEVRIRVPQPYPQPPLALSPHAQPGPTLHVFSLAMQESPHGLLSRHVRQQLAAAAPSLPPKMRMENSNSARTIRMSPIFHGRRREVYVRGWLGQIRCHLCLLCFGRSLANTRSEMKPARQLFSGSIGVANRPAHVDVLHCHTYFVPGAPYGTKPLRRRDRRLRGNLA